MYFPKGSLSLILPACDFGCAACASGQDQAQRAFREIHRGLPEQGIRSKGQHRATADAYRRYRRHFWPTVSGASQGSAHVAGLSEFVWKSDLEFTPGSRWEYSNYGFLLLGVGIEPGSGKSY